MCSTVQSPRARNAFSKACAARTWPAPEVAESKRTRGVVFIDGKLEEVRRIASGGLALSYCEPLEDAAAKFLQIAKARQVILEIVIQLLCFTGVQLCSQDHVAQ